MCCRIVDMRDKQVVCIKDGTILGYVCDVEIDTCSGRLNAIVVYGRRRFFGLFGKSDDCVIPWCDIQVIGQDTILVGFEPPRRRRRGKKGLFGSVFSAGHENTF